ncbi:hypothetical protein J2S42_001423 [Catenuloplanes indicus]|uniref:Uncharacterized protein n=1 Tax=Catenuloplanes indicus TaxID=137267 RepID=A0AAE3VWX9_9ACTN|nr:hypothetical protein [Catenuloplanes indicus]
MIEQGHSLKPSPDVFRFRAPAQNRHRRDAPSAVDRPWGADLRQGRHERRSRSMDGAQRRPCRPRRRLAARPKICSASPGRRQTEHPGPQTQPIPPTKKQPAPRTPQPPEASPCTGVPRLAGGTALQRNPPRHRTHRRHQYAEISGAQRPIAWGTPTGPPTADIAGTASKAHRKQRGPQAATDRTQRAPQAATHTRQGEPHTALLRHPSSVATIGRSAPEISRYPTPHGRHRLAANDAASPV